MKAVPGAGKPSDPRLKTYVDRYGETAGQDIYNRAHGNEQPNPIRQNTSQLQQQLMQQANLGNTQANQINSQLSQSLADLGRPSNIQPPNFAGVPQPKAVDPSQYGGAMPVQQPAAIDPTKFQSTTQYAQPAAIDPSKFQDPRLTAASAVKGADFSGFQEQQKMLQARLQDLMSGKGIDIGDVSKDPEARAYRVAKEREAARSRAAEAERLAASGMTGSGDFDAQLAGIRESTGEAIASQQAQLAGRRRGEAIEGATRAAALSLQDMDRQVGQERLRFETEFGKEQAERGRLADQLGRQFQAEQARFGTESENVNRQINVDRDRRDASLDAERTRFGQESTNADRALGAETTRRGQQLDADRLRFAGESDNAERAFRGEQTKFVGALEADKARRDSLLGAVGVRSAEASRLSGQQSDLLRTLLSEQGRQDNLATGARGNDLRNILLEQEILKNRKQPGVGYPSRPSLLEGQAYL